MRSRHLLVDITGHGFGHLAQTAPVLNALSGLDNNIRFSLRTSIDPTVVCHFLDYDIQSKLDFLPPSKHDFGMCMRNTLEIDRDKTFKNYHKLHQFWSEHVKAESKQLQQIVPDLLLSNIGYLGLAAAAKAKIPSIAMCSLDWASIFAAYCSEYPGAEQILDDMQKAYNSARTFIQLTPHLPMAFASNTKSAPPVSLSMQPSREKLEKQLGIEGKQLVLLSMGGMPWEMSQDTLPHINGVVWLAKQIDSPRDDIYNIDSITLKHNDIMASVDLIISKTGYGTIVQAAKAKVPILYIQRDKWAEEPHLWNWCKAHNNCNRITAEAFQQGDFRMELETLLNPSNQQHAEVEDGIPFAAEIIHQAIF